MELTNELFIQILQFFQPANPFYTSLLLEKKKFTLEEIHNKLLPCFFYSSFFGLFFCWLSVKHFQYFHILFTITGMQILAFFILILSKPRNIRSLQLSYIISGIYSIYNSALRLFIVNEKNPRVDMKIGQLKLLKNLITAISAWIGQGVYNQSHSYNLILTLTLIPLIYSEFYMAFIIMKGVVKHTNVQYFSKKMFTKELIIALVCSSTSVILQIYLSMFSQVMLRLKTTEFNNTVDKLFSIIDTPIKYISKGLVYIFSIFSNIYKPELTNNKPITIKSGYIEGTIKILSSITSLCLLHIFGTGVNDMYAIGLLTFAICSFFVLNHVNSIKLSYYLYFTTLVFLVTADTLAKNIIHKSESKLSATIIAMILESLIHSLINMFCRIKNYSLKFKSNIYLVYSLFSVLIAIGTRFYI